MAANSSPLHFYGPSIIVFVLCSLLVSGAILITIPTAEASSGVDRSYDWMIPPTTTAGNGGIIIDDDEEEFDMDTEINRRILATTNYISYGALQRNNVPCSNKGASYYNCKPGAEANPYARGCSSITRCRG